MAFDFHGNGFDLILTPKLDLADFASVQESRPQFVNIKTHAFQRTPIYSIVPRGIGKKLTYG